jgi:uncharacterized protein (DUF433 family)
MISKSEPAATRDAAITSDPRICGGKPVLAGTRIGVHDIVAYARHYDWSIARILVDLPDLSAEQVQSAFHYYHLHTDEIDELLRKRAEAFERGVKRQAQRDR